MSNIALRAMAALVVLLPLLTPTGAWSQAASPPSSPPADTEAEVVALDLRWDETTSARGARPLSRPVRLEPGTVIVGADWGGDEAASVEVRTRVDGTWGPWTPMTYDHEEGPDEGSAEAGTTWSDPVIVAGADQIQFRATTTRFEAQGVTVRDAGPDEVKAASVGAITAAPATTASQTPTGAPRPAIMSRAAWGADESLRDPRVPNYAGTVRFGVVHHTASGNNYTAEDSPRIVKGIYEYHVRSRGWWDIGYNFIVDKYGQVFEGRYGGVDRAVVGAHASGFNEAAVGVAVLGNYGSTPITAAGRAALEQLLAWKFTTHHVNPRATTTEVAGSGSRFSEGESATFQRLVGHRHLGYTECPGSIYDLLESGALADGVAGRMGPQIYTDVADHLVEDVIAPPTTFRVSTTDVADWKLVVTGPNGSTVHTRSWQGHREVKVTWDHKNAAGEWMAIGDYSLTVSATVQGGRALPDITIPLELERGLPEQVPLVGDWNGDGALQPGWWKQGRWVLHNGPGSTTTFWYGRAYDAPVVGDWNGDGRDEIGIIRDREWHLRRTASGGAGDIVFTYGRMTRGDLPLVGDWNGDGRDEIGIIRDREWHLRDTLSGGPADTSFIYGRITRGDIPIVGDWDGRGGDTIGIVRDGDWHLKNTLSGGNSDLSYRYGRVTQGDTPIVGDWNRDGSVTAGIVRGDEWHLRNSHSGGPATTVWTFAAQ